LLRDHQGDFLDSLSIGILYGIHKDNIDSIGPSDIPKLIESEQFKTAKKTVLLSLAEASLDRFDNPDEISRFSQYARSRLGKDAGLPTTNIGWKNFFIVALENNPQSFLEDYFINFRVLEDEKVIENSRNTFKLGELIAGEVAEADRLARSKIADIEDFLPYEDKEHAFLNRFWGSRMERSLRKEPGRGSIRDSLHQKQLDGDRHRAEQALIDQGVIDNERNIKSDFYRIFKDYYTKDTAEKHGQNQMVLGMLYSMRDELGVGVLPREEVLRRAKQIIPGLQRVGNDLLTNFIHENLNEFYPELVELIQKKGDTDNQEEFFSFISKNRVEVIRSLVNNRHIDGFGIGEIFGDVLKRTASEKKAEDLKSLTKLKEQTGDENAVMNLLIEGKEITDPKVRDRVERTMKKTSKLWRWTQRTATQLKVGAQKILFYKEGDTPWMRKPDLLGKAKSVGGALIDTAAFGYGVNFFGEQAVNRGIQGLLFMADYFIRDEYLPMRRELKARKNEIVSSKRKELGLEKPKGRWLMPFSKESIEYRKKIKEYMGPWYKKTKEGKEYDRFIKEQMKPIRKELNQRFWHNKGKMLFSAVSYGITSFGVNYLLKEIGLTGPESWAVLMGVNTGVSSLLSGMGLRTGAEFIVNAFGGKKAVDGGMELLTGYKKQEAPQKRLSKRKPNQAIEFIKKKGKPIATSIGSRIEIVKREGGVMATSLAKKIKLDNYLKNSKRDIDKIIKATEGAIKGTEEQNRNLAILERFVNRNNYPEQKFTKDELVETVEFLNWMKEEQELLLIHNPTVYSERKIRQSDGSFLEVDNREGLRKIDQTRGEIVEYAQNNLSKEDYDEVVKSSLDFFADVKNIRQKVFNKRMKYLITSYGYRATMMILSHVATESGGLLEKPANAIFGDATMKEQMIIGGDPTAVFHADTKTPEGVKLTAEEFYERAKELNNLVNLMGSSEELSEFQPGLENQLAYYGVNQRQIELLVDNLGKSNLNTSDLMRIIYVLSSYKEGQEYLAQMEGFDGTERRNLTPMIVNIAVDPVGFINRAMADRENAAILLLKYPDIAEKLEIKQESLADQLDPLVIPDEVKNEFIASAQPGGNPIMISNLGPQVIKVGDVVAEFIDGLSKGDRQARINLLIQINELYKADTSILQQAINHHYDSFLAESNNLVGTELTNKSINDLPIDSMIYKIYHAFGENGQLIPLLNRAKDGDVNAYNQLYALLENKFPNDKDRFGGTFDHSALRDRILDSQTDTTIYDKVLNNLPGEEILRKEEIVKRLQQEMLGLGLRPVGAPIMDLAEMTELAKDPAIFTDPRLGLVEAFTPGSDLEMAVSLAGSGTQQLFVVENNNLVGRFSSAFEPRTTFDEDALGILNAIEGSESENNRLSFPKMIYRNIGFALGLKETASGATTPAGTLIEQMSGPFGHGAINPEAPSALHNYDAYGPGYLAKLLVAHFRGRVPEDLLSQMTPDADLTQSIHEKNPTFIDRLCNKVETWIAADALTKKFGEDKVHEVYLNHFNVGTVDGIEVKGAEGAAEVLFAKPFNELTLGQKFLIEALGQQPNEYLYDIKLDENGKFIGMEPNPAKAITHALYLIEHEKAGIKLELYLGHDKKEQILEDLHNMQDRVNDEGWEKVFEGKLHLPAEAQNFFLTREAAGVQGMTLEEMQNAGLVESVAVTPDGTFIVLKDMVISEVIKTSPDQFMTPGELTSGQETTAQLSAQLGGLMTDAKREGNFFVTNSGVRIPVVEAGNDFVVPGLAVIEVGPDGTISQFDKTGMLSVGPQLVGSTYKPWEVYLLMKIHPEMNLGEQQYGASQRYFEGQLITNSTVAIDNMGSMKLNEALANSANVPMVDMWTKIREADPDIWFKYKDLAFKQFGIKFYELNSDGKFVEIMDDPFGRNKALAVGNVFVGGATPDESGMAQMAKAYQEIAEASVAGDPAGVYVIEALNNPDHKNVHVWGQDLIDNEFNPKMGDSTIAIKTGSQQGFDSVTGEPMAIRNIVAIVKIGPDGEVTTAFLETTGIDAQGKPVGLEWGSDLIPIVKDVISGTGVKISPDIARNGLNELFTNPNSGLNYQLGAVSVDHLYPLLKNLSDEEQYAYLREAIRTGGTKYLFVDLVGAPHDNIQSVAIHLKDATGADKLITLNVSANLIEPAGPVVGHFSETRTQTAIIDLLTQATQAEPEKYGGLLAQLQGQGVNFVSLHDYEASPALFAIHEQMEQRRMVLMGAEDAGAVMKALGLDPKTTVFVNDELFKTLNTLNPDVIKEKLFIQREYLAMAEIYESSGLPGALDSLIYDKDMTSNPSYQLLKIFAETKTSQVFKPVDGERLFLINKFQELVSNQAEAEKLAPDVITAYNLYNQMTDGIAREVPPTQLQAQEFINALNNFDKTTNERTLLSLGIGVNQPAPSVQTSTPLPPALATSIPQGPPVLAGVSLEGLKESGAAVLSVAELVNNFLKHPEMIGLPKDQRELAFTLTNNAQLLYDIVESPEAKNLQGQELMNYMTNHLPENIRNDGYVQLYITQISNDPRGRQCVEMSLLVNRILELEDPEHFKDIGKVDGAGDSAKSFISHLIEQKPSEGFLIENHFLTKFVDDVGDIKIGDDVVIAYPWLDNDIRSDYSHIAKVIYEGVEGGRPYILVFETDGDNGGVTQFRKIFDLNEFVSQKAWDTRAVYYPDPVQAARYVPIFGIVRYVGGEAQSANP